MNYAPDERVKMTKFVWTILILLPGLVGFARAQHTSSDTLSDADKTAIVESGRMDC